MLVERPRQYPYLVISGLGQTEKRLWSPLEFWSQTTTKWRASLRMMIAQRPDWQLVAQATDRVEAVEKAKTECPDVAVLDVQMPRPVAFKRPNSSS